MLGRSKLLTNTRRQLLRFVAEEHEGEAGIVYCESRRKGEETAAWLEAEGVAALPYHAGLDAAQRRHTLGRQPGGGLLDLAARLALDDAGLALVLLGHEAQ